ncbi:hypothetical protein EV421DRAFT_1903857 [Armillaria borealis]|uniref:Uncharacterized protein n=1 Tax=Armillaria borealis TaxID=47425 RepID=A0AA39JHJ0_9AGAR|nr:hypothetical protein EV421DRAFT_1903857 [Armillaria borealis]
MWMYFCRPLTSDGFRILAVHIDSEPDPVTGADILPISLSTTFAQSSASVHKGYSTPYDALGKLIANLESKGGEVLTFSSRSATALATLGKGNMFSA